MTRLIRVPSAVLLAAVLTLTACTERTARQAGPQDAASADTSPNPVRMETYWRSHSQVREFVSEAAELPDRLRGADARGCAAVAAELDRVGAPEDVYEALAEAPDPVVAEALLEQQAGVSSALAACRGDAPISLEEALEELRVSNAALLEILREAGLE